MRRLIIAWHLYKYYRVCRLPRPWSRAWRVAGELA